MNEWLVRFVKNNTREEVVAEVDEDRNFSVTPEAIAALLEEGAEEGHKEGDVMLKVRGYEFLKFMKALGWETR